MPARYSESHLLFVFGKVAKHKMINKVVGPPRRGLLGMKSVDKQMFKCIHFVSHSVSQASAC